MTNFDGVCVEISAACQQGGRRCDLLVVRNET